MTEHQILTLAVILALGIGAQWLAWRFHLPSILLLLVLGFVAGPVTGFLDPDALFGELLLPLVSLSVAIILFEGGLSLRVSELREIGRIVRNLISVGVLVTWTATAAAAYVVLRLPLDLALLLGAILVVTGPTVIIPLLRHVRPTRRVGAVARWEGIVNDPIGAILAVLVFEAILAGGFGEATAHTVLGVLTALLIGGGIGLAGAAVLVLLLRRYWVPDFLQNPVALAVIVAAFALAERFQAESGLLAATLMGIALANQRLARVEHIAEFKENLRVLLLAGLFIVLAARLPLEYLPRLGWHSLLFVAILMLVVRPLAVAASARGSALTWRERLFLVWMAPRGIVAASVASIFALVLAEAGRADAEELVPITFLVITCTVAIYGLTAAPLARWLGVAEPEVQGALLIGAHAFARAVARILQERGFRVVLADTNRTNARAARLAGLTAFHGNVLSEPVEDRIDLSGIGRVLALTSNDEVNSLVAVHVSDVFDASEIYQLRPASTGEGEAAAAAMLRARPLFREDATYQAILSRIDGGATVKVTRLTNAFDYAAFQRMYGEEAIPMFLIREKGRLLVFTADQRPTPAAGDVLISLAPTAAQSVPEAARGADAMHRE
ncbi:MAG: sodium:proton antiporter [Gemmatimonadetes bacterium]|nr:sodium:proton antiporter [Gemmatimonadota bacterium]